MTTTEASQATLPLHRNRDWNLLMTGATVSAVGSGMTALAFLMLTFAITGSSARAGFADAMVAAGTLLAMLPAGALVDRWNRKHTMVWTAVAGAVAFLTIPLAARLGHLTYPHLLVVAFVEGMLGCFYGPAEKGALKRIVAPEQMGTASSATMARSSLGSLVGPPLSGALYGISRTLPMLGDALSFAWAAGCAALVRTPLPAPERAHRTNLVQDVREGLRWVWRTAPMRDVTGLALLLNLGINGMVTVAILALQRQGTPATHLGLMESATGVAGLVGALLAPAVLSKVRTGPLVLVGFALTSVLGLALLASASIWWIGGVLCVVMLMIMPVNSGMGAYVMHITPDEMQGRGSSASGFVTMAAMPLASAAGGLLLERWGRIEALVVFAVPLVLATALSAFSRAIRSIPRMSDLASVPQASEESAAHAAGQPHPTPETGRPGGTGDGDTPDREHRGLHVDELHQQ